MSVLIDEMKNTDIDMVAAIDGPTRMTHEQLRAEVERPWARLWVAREIAPPAPAVVAFLIAWHVVDELHVLNVATRPDCRRRGMARALMNRVIAYARGARARHLLLEVRRTNLAAIALYRTMGFFAMGIRARYYQDDEDAVEMALILNVETGEIVPHADEVQLPG